MIAMNKWGKTELYPLNLRRKSECICVYTNSGFIQLAEKMVWDYGI